MSPPTAGDQTTSLLRLPSEFCAKAIGSQIQRLDWIHYRGRVSHPGQLHGRHLGKLDGRFRKGVRTGRPCDDRIQGFDRTDGVIGRRLNPWSANSDVRSATTRPAIPLMPPLLAPITAVTPEGRSRVTADRRGERNQSRTLMFVFPTARSRVSRPFAARD